NHDSFRARAALRASDGPPNSHSVPGDASQRSTSAPSELKASPRGRHRMDPTPKELAPCFGGRFHALYDVVVRSLLACGPRFAVSSPTLRSRMLRPGEYLASGWRQWSPTRSDARVTGLSELSAALEEPP